MKVEEELVCSCNKIIALHERILGEKRKSDRIYRTRCICSYGELNIKLVVICNCKMQLRGNMQMLDANGW